MTTRLNIIYNELRYRRYATDVGLVEIVERTTEGKRAKKGLEIDFKLLYLKVMRKAGLIRRCLV